MEIIKYSPNLLRPLTRFYNQHIEGLPNCFPIKEGELAKVLWKLNGGKENSEKGLDEEEMFIAIHSGKIIAFIHAGVQEYDNDEKDIVGYIKFLSYKRGERIAGQAVLEAAEEFLTTFDINKIIAFSSDIEARYRFHQFEYNNLSNYLDHIQALLACNGYKPGNGWASLNWENFDAKPVLPDQAVKLTIEWEDGKGERANCTVKAKKDEEDVGECECVSVGTFSQHPEAQDWIYTSWIGIEEKFRGQGHGKYLLQYTLQEMQKVGYRHAILNTVRDNYRALLFYTDLGYKIVDWTYEYAKDLSENSSQE